MLEGGSAEGKTGLEGLRWDWRGNLMISSDVLKGMIASKQLKQNC